MTRKTLLTRDVLVVRQAHHERRQQLAVRPEPVEGLAQMVYKYLFLLIILFVPVLGQAQTWPARPIRFIVPFPPGGGTDVNARIIAPRLSAVLGQQVVVENRTGAGGMVGTEVVAKSPPDGYSMVIATIGPIAINPHLYAKMTYDPAKELAPVTITGEVPNGLVVHPTLPAKTLKELIALAKQRPRELNYGSSGAGAGDHLAAEMLGVMAGIRMTHVPYKGGPLAMVDLMSGNIQLIFATLATGMPYIRAGRVRTLAVASAQRYPLLPEVPTVAEAGVPGFAVNNWAGIFVPAGTPRAIIERLNVEVVKILGAQDVRQKLLEMGLVAGTNTPGEFAAYIQSEGARWAKVIKDANIRLD
jgi:tripartite-type tricarboxylate transporter receptor subunit TctC